MPLKKISIIKSFSLTYQRWKQQSENELFALFAETHSLRHSRIRYRERKKNNNLWQKGLKNFMRECLLYAKYENYNFIKTINKKKKQNHKKICGKMHVNDV